MMVEDLLGPVHSPTNLHWVVGKKVNTNFLCFHPNNCMCEISCDYK